MTGADGKPSPPKPFSESIVETAFALSQEWNMTPFEILQQDIDNFIMLANYLIRLGRSTENEATKTSMKNDGFWDF